MNPKNPMRESIQSACEQQQVDPAGLVVALLSALQEHHLFSAGFAFQDPVNQRTVFDEIMGYVNAFNPKKEIPPSLLALLDTILRLRGGMDTHNAEVMRQNNRIPEAESLAFRGRAAKALRMVIQQTMNAAEHMGLEGRLNVEKRWGKKMENFDPNEKDEEEGMDDNEGETPKPPEGDAP